MTGEYSELQGHHYISLSQNKLYGAVEIFMAVFIEKFIGEFFYEHCHKKSQLSQIPCFGLKKFSGEAVILNILLSLTIVEVGMILVSTYLKNGLYVS